MLSGYCTALALHQENRGMDNYGQPLYADGKLIPCRKQYAARSNSGKNERSVHTPVQYFLVTAVGVDDLLDGRPVVSVLERTGLFGEPRGWEAVCC